MKKRILVILLSLTVIFECVSCHKAEQIGETQAVLPKEAPQSESAEEAAGAEPSGLSPQADRTPNVAELWIDEDTSIYANLYESRICYDNGYYYYVSQSDNYFLYRMKVDGSEPQCLVKAHCTGICALDGDVYFVNQSDGHSIYRLKAGTAEAEKLCEYGHDLQVSGEYVYFFARYNAQYDTYGLT